MHKWIIAIAAVFIVALFTGISIGRYHYEHITLKQIENNFIETDSRKNIIIQDQLAEIQKYKVSLQKKETPQQEISQRVDEILNTPIRDIFFGETIESINQRFPGSVVDCNENEEEFKTWLFTNQEYAMNPLFSLEALKINTCKSHVYAIEICYLSSEQRKESCYSELSQRLLNKYRLINLDMGPVLTAMFAGYKLDCIYDTLVFDKRNGIYIILTKVRDMGISLKYFSPEVLIALCSEEKPKPDKTI